MQIRVNGKPEQVDAGVTIAVYLAAKRLDTQRVAVELNGRIVRRDAFGATALGEGDCMEVVHFVGGG